MNWILGFIAFWVIAFFVVDYNLSAPGYKGPETDHFDGKKFGLSDQHKARSLFDIIKWGVSGDRGTWRECHEYNHNPQLHQAAGNHISVTFVNHSTFLLQIDGLNILTDPVWSDRASPYSWIGPRRMRPPGIQFDDLPKIDLVLISHNHYDHLDLPTVLRLNERFSPRFITPLGVDKFLNQNGIKNTVDLDWWDATSVNEDAKITSVPSKHFSGRGVLDRDKTLWCGFVLQSPSATIYFAGDTAYDDFFPEIGKRFSPIDIAFIPIGAYRPRWFMRPIHCNPEEAVQIHRDVHSIQSIATHFGTFPLADEGMNEPLRDLKKALDKYDIPLNDFSTLEEGKNKIFTPSNSLKELSL